LRDVIVHSTSTKQYLASLKEIPSLKASQLLKLLTRFCPSPKEAIQKYLIDQNGKTADIDDFIKRISKSCREGAVVKEFLED
ncbi:hypothetical protein PMAYCL1PPCAC_07916, partial [Pristionchus mayeri]